MNKTPLEQPPPYNEVDSSRTLHTQGQPIIQPAITNQPTVQQQQQQIVSTINIVQTGGCRHNFRSEFTCCGIFCAIFLFPLGLICCFCMRKQRCKHCNLYA